jgi:hypothetical protein
MSMNTTTAAPAGGAGAANQTPNRVILACEMMEDEVRLALEQAFPGGDHPPLVWFESGLHDRPEKLQVALQALLDAIDAGAERGETIVLPSVRPGVGPAESRREWIETPPVDEVLLALGYCGKGLQGLVAAHARLVFPRVDDCISLFLNHGCVREEIPRDAQTYYLTRGWLCHESSALDSYEKWQERYGPEKALELRKIMFAAYRRIALIDTGAYEVDGSVPEATARAEELGLDVGVVAGSIQLLVRLFAGPWDSEIQVVGPGTPITVLHLMEA